MKNTDRDPFEGLIMLVVVILFFAVMICAFRVDTKSNQLKNVTYKLYQGNMTPEQWATYSNDEQIAILIGEGSYHAK